MKYTSLKAVYLTSFSNDSGRTQFSAMWFGIMILHKAFYFQIILLLNC